MVEIKHKITGKILHTIDADNLRGADLTEADIHGADLRGVNLTGVDMTVANLRWANLHGANLRGADLRWADLTGANLTGADLRGADLRWANLTGAKLHGNISYAASDCKYQIIAIRKYVLIGCKTMTVYDWLTKGDAIARDENISTEERERYRAHLLKIKEIVDAVEAQ